MLNRAAGAGSSTSSGVGARYANRLTPAGPVIVDPNIGGRVQIKLGFEAGTLQLIVTIVCAAGLTLRANGAARNPYVKVSSIALQSAGLFFPIILQESDDFFPSTQTIEFRIADFFASRSMRQIETKIKNFS